MNVVVWGENIHEKKNPLVTEIYPGGIHGYVASYREAWRAVIHGVAKSRT